MNEKEENILRIDSDYQPILSESEGKQLQDLMAEFQSAYVKNKDKSMWIRKDNTHEAIIDKETFNKVQFAIKERTKPIKRTGNVHIFSGKVLCMECNHYMRKKNSSKHEYLVCSSNNGYNECKNKEGIRYDKLEKLILNEINKKIKKFYDEKELEYLISNNLNSRIEKKIKSLEVELIDTQNKISKTKNYLKNIYEDKVNEIITTEQFKNLITNYNKEENVYKEQIKSLTKKITYYEKKEFSKDYNEILSKYQNLTKLNRVIIEEFIDKIYIGKINNITKIRNIKIKWNLN